MGTKANTPGYSSIARSRYKKMREDMMAVSTEVVDDLMPTSFVLGLTGSVAAGLAIWAALAYMLI